MPTHTPAFTGFSPLCTRSSWNKPRQRHVPLLFLPSSSPQVSLDFQAIGNLGALAPLLPQWSQSHYVILRATSVSCSWRSFFPGCFFVNMKTLFSPHPPGSFNPETQRIFWNQLRPGEAMDLGLFLSGRKLPSLPYPIQATGATFEREPRPGMAVSTSGQGSADTQSRHPS